jgi:uncharacterized protein (UPF0305 family)
MRPIKLYDFVKAVNYLDNTAKPITFYNIKKLKNGLSNKLILDCLQFCAYLGFMNKKTRFIGERKTKVYYKRLTWYLLERYLLIMIKKE